MVAPLWEWLSLQWVKCGITVGVGPVSSLWEWQAIVGPVASLWEWYAVSVHVCGLSLFRIAAPKSKIFQPLPAKQVIKP